MNIYRTAMQCYLLHDVFLRHEHSLSKNKKYEALKERRAVEHRNCCFQTNRTKQCPKRGESAPVGNN